MIKKVEQYIKGEHLIEPNSKILVAVSGGPDSVVLLDVLFKLRSQFGYRLIVAHFNHKIREEADKDEEFVSKLAKKYGLEVVTGKPKIKIDSEDEAREARYSFFKEIMDKKDIKYLALAQNLSDQAETITHNFIRGTGLKGLAGISPKRKLGSNYAIRPLMSVSREEIIDYARDNSLKYVVDRTNLETSYTRNKIRHQIMPALKELNPNLEEGLVNQGELLSEISEHLNSLSSKFISRNVKIDNSMANIDQQVYLQLDQAVRSSVIRLVISNLSKLENISYVHLEEIEDIFKQTSSDKKVKQFKGLKFSKQAGRIRIEKSK